MQNHKQKLEKLNEKYQGDAFSAVVLFIKCKQKLSYSLWFGDKKFLRKKIGYNLSDSKIDRYIQIMINEGWVAVRERAGKKEYKFNKNIQRKFKIKAGKDCHYIQEKLIKRFLDVKISQKDYVMSNKKADCPTKDSGFKCIRENEVGKIDISYEGIAKSMGISKTYAFNIIRKMLRRGLITRETLIRELYRGDDFVSVFKNASRLHQGVFCYNGAVYKQERNRYGNSKSEGFSKLISKQRLELSTKKRWKKITEPSISNIIYA